MSVERSGKLNAVAWTVLIAAPVVYMLSIPWAEIWEPFGEEWTNRYCAPYEWFERHTPLIIPMWDYQVWCHGEALKHGWGR